MRTGDCAFSQRSPFESRRFTNLCARFLFGRGSRFRNTIEYYRRSGASDCSGRGRSRCWNSDAGAGPVHRGERR